MSVLAIIGIAVGVTLLLLLALAGLFGELAERERRR